MKTLWIMTGIPGCGKSFVATQALMHDNTQGWVYISRDEIRYTLLADNEEYFSHENEVYEIFIHKIVEALKSDNVYNVIADATHLNWHSRRKLLKGIGKEYDLRILYIIPVVVQSELDTCKYRNSRRTGRQRVPDNVIEQMYESYRHPRNDPFSYDGIMDFDNEKVYSLEDAKCPFIV